MASNRMNGKTQAFQEMYRLCMKHKDLLIGDDDPGKFYRRQKLMTAINEGEIDESNLEDMMNVESLVGDTLPMEWYYDTNKAQRIQTNLVMNNLELSGKKRSLRGKVTPLRLRMLMQEILKRRIDKYLNPEEYMNNKILCIVGESGAGKTLASLHLQNKLGANVICSFTTRPPRTTEVEGREHHFINIVPDPNEMLAYANFGGYDYYALKTQVFGPCTVYVIDEQGLVNLMQDHGDEYDIYSVYITRDDELKRKVGVGKGRRNRDKKRMTLPMDTYNWVIENNSTKKAFFVQIEDIYNEVMAK